MRPSLETLMQVGSNPREVAKHFGVCKRTAIRWLQFYNQYKPISNYGPGKLDQLLAEEIRNKRREGKSLKQLAKEYKVTVATISRVVNHLIYKDSHSFSKISVIYNP